MIKFFRKIRQNLLSEGKTGKYFKYAIGEIILVVIGILIALYLDDLKDKNKEQDLRSYYIQSIKKDLIQDQVIIKKMIDSVQNSLEIIDGQVNRIYSQSSTIDTLIKIAKNEFLTEVSSISFNDNSLKSLISTGSLNLLQTDFSELLLELNKTRSEQKEVRNTLASMYNERINEYHTQYPRPYDDLPEDNLVNRILWTDIDEKDFVGKFRGILLMKRYKEREFLKDLKSSQKQAIFLIDYIDNNYESVNKK
jgi:hypothetical protein